MNSLLKIVIVATGIAIVSSTVVVIMKQARPSHKIMAQPQGWPTAISNYSKTFKLTTNTPIWTTSANGRNATN